MMFLKNRTNPFYNLVNCVDGINRKANADSVGSGFTLLSPNIKGKYAKQLEINTPFSYALHNINEIK